MSKQQTSGMFDEFDLKYVAKFKMISAQQYRLLLINLHHISKSSKVVIKSQIGTLAVKELDN